MINKAILRAREPFAIGAIPGSNGGIARYIILFTTEEPDAMGHRITTDTRNGRTVYTLHDDASKASASILPSYGFNLFDLRLPVGKTVLPLIDAFPDFAENPRSPGRNGIPVLFPFPNRVKDGKFTFKGKNYTLPITNGNNAIHGFALSAPWDVTDQSTEGGEASITGHYQISKNSPEMRDNWPTDAAIQIRYGLSGRKLTMTVTVSNPTADDLPYGFGVHPYFRCPFQPGGDLSKTKVILPAARYWVLAEFIPTGETKPVDDRLDFRKGQPMKGLKLDDVLSGLTFDGDKCLCRLVDETLGAEFRLSFDRKIRELVVYTPPGDGNVISLEPYTQTTDAVNLETRKVNGGLRVLGHGKSDTFVIAMETVG